MVRAELPGLSDKDVRVEIADDALVLQGERRVETEQEGQGGIRRTERHYGRFYRSIPLPEGANPDQARADFNHGVLEVTIPLTQARRRQIPIGTQEKGGQGKQAA